MLMIQKKEKIVSKDTLLSEAPSIKDKFFAECSVVSSIVVHNKLLRFSFLIKHIECLSALF